MAKSVVEAYNAYPVTDVNKYSVEINAKRVGFQQGYEKGQKDLIVAVLEFLRTDSRCKYMLDSCDWTVVGDIKNLME